MLVLILLPSLGLPGFVDSLIFVDEMFIEQICKSSSIYPIGSMYAIYGNIDPINIPPLC